MNSQIQTDIEEIQNADWELRIQQSSTTHNLAVEAEEAAKKALGAAENELAGVETGDGRDEFNRSLSQQLADAQKEQVWFLIAVLQSS